LVSGGNTLQISGAAVGLAAHVGAIAVLLLGYREFPAKVRRGALYKSAAALGAGWVLGIAVSWALLEVFPGSLARGDRLPYAVDRVIGFALADPDLFSGKPHVFLNDLLGLFGALALMAAAVVLFQSQRADN